MKKWKICLINLERSTDRLAACASQLDSYGLPFDRVEAVNGDTLDVSTINNLYNFSDSSYHKHMTRGELGCYLSHVRAWRAIVRAAVKYPEDGRNWCRPVQHSLVLRRAMGVSHMYARMRQASVTRRHGQSPTLQPVG